MDLKSLEFTYFHLLVLEFVSSIINHRVNLGKSLKIFQVAKNHKEAFSSSNVHSAIQPGRSAGSGSAAAPAPRAGATGISAVLQPRGSAGAGDCCWQNWSFCWCTESPWGCPSSCGCQIQGQVGCGLEQPQMVEGAPALDKVLKLGDL